tara:strand:+ start:1940 stop:2968 length:1029 start_codon:yes stop_codon:yes gene_type:complete
MHLFKLNMKLHLKMFWLITLVLTALDTMAVSGGAQNQETTQVQSKQNGEITNSIGMKLKLIPAGEFLMGSSISAEECVRLFKYDLKYYANELPQHKVIITKPFYMGVFEVTISQFRLFVKETGYQTEPEKDGEGGWGWNESTGKFEGRTPSYSWKSTGYKMTGNYPVLNVTWNDAVAFCDWLSQKEGTTYRLPTEAEWEYACRAGTTSMFQTGDSSKGLSEVSNIADQTAKEKLMNYQSFSFLPERDGYTFTAPVGQYRPNSFGLYDMHGNVFEWCQDWFSASYYKHSPETDPPGPTTGSLRIMRSGSWYDYVQDNRSSYRLRAVPEYRSLYLGFRVVCEPE